MKAVPICSIPDSGWAQPVNISDIMRNIRVLRVNDCSTKVDCERRESIHDSWKSATDYVGNNMMVYPSAEPIQKEIKIELPKEKKVLNPHRGRARVEVNIEWPKQFKMKDLVAKYPEIGYPILYLRVKEARENGVIKEIGREKVAGAKGKPSVIYERIE